MLAGDLINETKPKRSDRSCLEKALRFVDWFIPLSMRGDDRDVFRRARLLVMSSFGVTLFALFFLWATYATQGQSYMIRIGGFTVGSQGTGTLALRCDSQPLCDVAAGDCFATGGNGSPGCDDANCCETTCAADPFCCDVTWDSTCAAEAQGLCTGSFAACSTSTGACDAGNGGGGCEDESCCNLVCAVDPFCCVDTWDGFCATEAASICGLNCGTTGAPRNNACDIVADPRVNIPVAGCSDETTCKNVCTIAPECCLEAWGQKCVCLAVPSDPCCEAVCAVDAFCCNIEWDDFCDEQAADLCP